MTVHIVPALLADIPEVTRLVEALLCEIMEKIGEAAFQLETAHAMSCLKKALSMQKTRAWLAQEASTQQAVGVILVSESFAVYAGGIFGTITELYVQPAYRKYGIGKQLIDTVRLFGQQQQWKRLEATSPPLPEFADTVKFYQREGFGITGGRKLKVLL